MFSFVSSFLQLDLEAIHMYSHVYIHIYMHTHKMSLNLSLHSLNYSDI